ncbi:hypothetical protein [Reichenbachiella versicolor]|uniref:hypothetical protein n=1 Tax=Reichenbachiella versicolor TaxID=1821036 RepID=UPI000D6DF52C|nr:hypothetical protein [Reichenbachiella versicolor]
MNIKDKYLDLLKKNDGQLNEIELGESIGLDEDEMQEIISMLLFEYKIEYVQHRACNYRIYKKSADKHYR